MRYRGGGASRCAVKRCAIPCCAALLSRTGLWCSPICCTISRVRVDHSLICPSAPPVARNAAASKRTSEHTHARTHSHTTLHTAAGAPRHLHCALHLGIDGALAAVRCVPLGMCAIAVTAPRCARAISHLVVPSRALQGRIGRPHGRAIDRAHRRSVMRPRRDRARWARARFTSPGSVSHRRSVREKGHSESSKIFFAGFTLKTPICRCPTPYAAARVK